MSDFHAGFLFGFLLALSPLIVGAVLALTAETAENGTVDRARKAGL